MCVHVCARPRLQEGKRATMAAATDTLASSMNSSTIELVSRSCWWVSRNVIVKGLGKNVIGMVGFGGWGDEELRAGVGAERIGTAQCIVGAAWPASDVGAAAC
jgi:hypothetical protein